MLQTKPGRAFFFLAFLVPLLGCSKKESPPQDAARAEYVAPEAEFSQLRYPDGQVTLNDRCPVRKAKLNPRMVPVYVNGRPVGFC